MSILGKILAVFNILGAIGLIYFASLNFGVRQMWQREVAHADFIDQGLPLTDQDLDERGFVIADRLDAKMLSDLFKDAGVPVKTQVEEVKKVHQAIDAKLNESSDKKRQLGVYARFLVPFAASNYERDQLLSERNLLSDDKSAEALKEYLKAAHARAKNVAGMGKVPFIEAFKAALGGETGDAEKPFDASFVGVGGLKVATGLESTKSFNDALVKVFTADANKPFDQAYESAIDELHAGRKAKLDTLFADAEQRTKPVQGGSGERPANDHRQVIAHLLFNLVEVPLTEAVAGQPVPMMIGPVNDIYQIEGYRRFVAVVGLESAVKEINRQARVLEPIVQELRKEITREQSTFALKHSAALSQVLDLGEKLTKAKDDLDRSKQQLAVQDELVAKRKIDVKQAQDDLDKGRKITAEKLNELRIMSKALYNIRIEVREATVENQNRARRIEELEETFGKN